MKTELSPIPLTEKEQAKLLGLPVWAIRAYQKDLRYLIDRGLDKLDFLNEAWQTQTTKYNDLQLPDLKFNVHEIDVLKESIECKLARVRYQLYHCELQLVATEKQYRNLILKSILLQITLSSNIFCDEAIKKLEDFVKRAFERYGPHKKLALEYQITLLKYEETIQMQMIEKLHALRQKLGN
jgi:hypothetical protein